MKASFDEITKAEFDKLVQPIINIYSQIELDLMLEVAKRFENYDAVAGSLEWQMQKLNEMGALNAAVVKKISEYSGVAESAIEEMLKAASVLNIDTKAAKEAYEKGVIGVDPKALFETPAYKSTLEKSFVSTKDTFRLINTRAVEGAKRAYMDVLNRAYIEVSSGIYGYNTSISRALQHMADKGIECATYKRGAKIVHYGIESCVRRDVLTATNKLANAVAAESVEELGAEYVYVSRHLGARVSEKSKIANHAGWQGKVYKLEGYDEEYKNLREETGYPDEIEGLSGVNCRHRIFPFFPGVTVLPKSDFDEEESEKLYELSQKQRAKEREIRKTKKKLAVAEASNDEETAKKLRNELIERQDDIASFCEDNGLVRQYERENVYFNSAKAKNSAKSNEFEPKSGTNSPESIENAVENGILKTEKGATGHEITAKILKNEHYDRQQYENYKQVVGDIVPKTLAEFRKLKYGEPEAWKDLQAKFKIVNRYEVDGNVSTEEILKLDEIAWNTKRKEFSFDGVHGRTRNEVKALRKSGNVAAMRFNGDYYFSHSKIDHVESLPQGCYSGKYQIIGKPKNKLFKTIILDGYDRTFDTEAKFLEFVAQKMLPKSEFVITILSERHICESCQGVVTQFKAMFPKATVNVISGKRGYNNDPEGNHTWTYRKDD